MVLGDGGGPPDEVVECGVVAAGVVEVGPREVERRGGGVAGGAAVVNLVCALVLARFRGAGGSMVTGAFLSARNDVLVNVAIIVVGVLTALTMSGWPDIVLGVGIVVLNVRAAREVWELAHEEHLAARALAGEDLD